MTHLATLETPLLDAEHLETLKMIAEDGPKSFLEELLGTYTAEWEQHLAEVKKTSAAKDNPALRKIAHLIAGSSANMGFGRLSQLCKTIETQIDEGSFEDYEQAPGLIEKDYQASLQAFQEYLNTL